MFSKKTKINIIIIISIIILIYICIIKLKNDNNSENDSPNSKNIKYDSSGFKKFKCSKDTLNFLEDQKNNRVNTISTITNKELMNYNKIQSYNNAYINEKQFVIEQKKFPFPFACKMKDKILIKTNKSKFDV